MTEERKQYDNSGILFTNNRKREGKKDADFTGTLTVNGEEYWINMWDRSGAKGPFRTVSISKKVAKSAEPQTEPTSRPAPFKRKPEPQPPNDMDDEIPF